MGFSKFSFKQFIILSLLLHALVIGGVKFLNHEVVLKESNQAFTVSLGNVVEEKVAHVSSPKKTNSPKTQDVLPEKTAPAQSKTNEAETPAATEESGTSAQEQLTIKDTYRSRIYSLLNSKKQYPAKARALKQQGIVSVRITLSKSGKLLDAKIIDASQFKILSESTLDVIKDIKKFPEIPNELGLEEISFNVPFEYKIQDF